MVGFSGGNRLQGLGDYRSRTSIHITNKSRIFVLEYDLEPVN